MRDQTIDVSRKLILAIKSHVDGLREQGKTVREIAEVAKISRPFLSNLMNDNQQGMNGLSINKLISIANALGMSVSVDVSQPKKTKKAS